MLTVLQQQLCMEIPQPHGTLIMADGHNDGFVLLCSA